MGRLVAIGDLNAAADVLIDILRGTGLTDRRGRWIGGRSRLVQIGDIWNRGPGARAATELLLDLQQQARAAGGEITILLGNHEVMTSLGVEAYCTVAEYLSFATASEKRAWPRRVERMTARIHRSTPKGEIVPPLGPRVELWKAMNAPGRKAMRRALGPRGRIGREIRKWPVSLRHEDLVFSHAGLTPAWAAKGLDTIEEEARTLWAARPTSVRDMAKRSLFKAADGPLWDRSLASGPALESRRALELSLRLLKARRMVIGHTRTDHVPRGRLGRIALRFGGKLVCIDVGLWSGRNAPRIALLVERGQGWEWSPTSRRRLW
jgi:hypothetical protein